MARFSEFPEECHRISRSDSFRVEFPASPMPETGRTQRRPDREIDEYDIDSRASRLTREA